MLIAPLCIANQYGISRNGGQSKWERRRCGSASVAFAAVHYGSESKGPDDRATTHSSPAGKAFTPRCSQDTLGAPAENI